MKRYSYAIPTEGFSGTQKLFYIFDELGSVVAITNADGMPLKYYIYDPWGNITNTSSDPINNLTFVGRYGGLKDWDTGLIQFQHRWYDSEIGKWISRDPINIRGGINLYGYVDTVGKASDLNLYEYAFNNPTFWTDRLGLCPDTGCTEKRNCDKTVNNDDLGNCLKNARDNYLKGLAIYFGATAPFHEVVVIGCWAIGPGFAACMASVGLILEISDLVAIGGLTVGYLQVKHQCYDLYGCKGK